MSRLNPKNLETTYLNNYITYLEDAALKHTVGIGKGKAKEKTVDCYVKPFNVALPNNVVAKASATVSGRTALAAKLTDNVLLLLGTNEAVGLAFYKAARVVLITGKLAKGREAISHRTKRPYDNYYNPEGGTVSTSFPFGQPLALVGSGVKELHVFEGVRNEYEVDGALPNGTALSLTKEKFSSRT